MTQYTLCHDLPITEQRGQRDEQASSERRARRGSLLLPVGRLLVVALPLVFAVQESLQLRRRTLLVLGRQRGRLAGLTLPAGGRGRGRTRLLGAPPLHAVHQIGAVHTILSRGRDLTLRHH